MFNVVTICESVKRHLLPIIVIVALCFCAGVGSSFVKKGEISVAPTYTAEASLYVTNYGYEDGSDSKETYNYSLSESMIITEMRRIVVSDAVAGEVRREYGEDVSITSPYWIEESTNDNYIERFIFIDVVAEDPEVALAATEVAAQLTIEQASALLPVDDIVVADAPYLKSTGADSAADWGSDDFANVEQQVMVDNVASGISVKNIVIYLFVGIVLSVFGFAAYDILSRRIRSAGDVERLLDVPVLAEITADRQCEQLAESVRVLMHRHGLETLSVAGACTADGASSIADCLKGGGVSVSDAVSLADDVAAVSAVASSDAVLLVVKSAAASGSQLEQMLKLLKVAGTPVLGAVFVSKNR